MFLGAYSGARIGASRVTWKERAAIPLAMTTALLVGAMIWSWRRPAPADTVLRTELTIADSSRLTPQPGILLANAKVAPSS